MSTPNHTFVPSALQVYQSDDLKLDVRFANKEVWLSQKQLAELLDKNIPAISKHIADYKESSPDVDSVVSVLEITATDGKKYQVEHYSMDVIVYVAYRVQANERVWAFRRWVSGILTRYITGGLRETEQYSYENVRALMTLASDYDPHSAVAQRHFATIQNKLLYAASRHTAADLRATRADHTAPNMGLQVIRNERVTLADANVGKNYLTPDELRRLNGLVTILNVAADDFISRGIHTMDEWEKFVDGQILHMKRELLMGRGQHTTEQADAIVRREYNAYKRLLP